ncbi:MAG: hypothetical protein AAFX99_26430, partial [Myxococcota bacterium]
ALFVLGVWATACGDDSERAFDLPDEPLDCGSSNPCGGSAVGGGGAGGGSNAGSTTITTTGEQTGGVVLVEGLETILGQGGQMLVLKDCQVGNTCLTTFTAKNNSGEEQEFELRYAPEPDFQNTLDLDTSCNRSLRADSQCNSTLSFSGFPDGFEHQCLGELSFYADNVRVLRIPACSESIADACITSNSCQ